MSLERRLLACVLLMVSALPLPLALLPAHLDAAIAPLAVASAGAAITLVPSIRALQLAGWLAAALLLTSAVFANVGLASAAGVVVLPFGALALTRRASHAAVAGAVGAAAIVWTSGVSNVAALSAFSWATLPDVTACLMIWGWGAWLLAAPAVVRGARRRLALQRTTAHALGRAIARDRRWLDAVAGVVTDASLGGPIRGAGLREGSLAVAARLDDRRVLLGWLEGPALATLSAAWALTAAGRAGLHAPAALLRFAREQLDEVLPESGLSWLAVWDRRSGALRCTRRNSPSVLQRCVLTAKGPAEVANAEPADAEGVLAELLPAPEDLTNARMSVAASVAAASTGAVAIALTLVPSLPSVALAAVVGGLLLGHEAARRSAARNEAALTTMVAELRDRTELHDDIRFQVAKLHGGLLPYQMVVGDAIATAHRLRGEVLDGSFADLVRDASGDGQVLAGEVAGRGIAARFLGLAAQVMARTMLTAGSVDPRATYPRLAAQLRPLARALRYPARLRLGAVSIDENGICQSYGTLGKIVVVRGASEFARTEPLAPTERVRVATSAELDADTRAYLSPAPSVPGPEDDAPALSQGEAADRVVDVVSAGQWVPQRDSLASLFSLVFDGTHAPAHGTLVELASLRPDERQGEGEGREASDESDDALAIAAL